MSEFSQKQMAPNQLDARSQFEIDLTAIAETAKRRVKAGRNLSLALTKLEEAAMWLNKAIAHDGLND